MKNDFVKRLFVLAVLAGLCFTGACGGGGSSSSSDVTALTLPSHIGLGEAEYASTGLSGYGYDDPGTDYTEEPKEIWVDDTDALQMVNDILGAVQDSGYEHFVNAGPYKALVKKVGESEESQGGTTTTSASAESLQEITVEVTRANNDAPMIIKVWVKEDDGPGDASVLIRGYFEVFEGVSEEYPYGILEAHFRGNKLDDYGVELPEDPVFTMAMKVSAENGDVNVQFLDVGEEQEGPYTFQWIDRARIVSSSDLSSGNAYIYIAETDWDTQQLEEETCYYAFNEEYLRYQEVGETETTVLNKNDLHHQVYQYKLFDRETGDRITANAGFPIRLEDGQYAYVGYYGLWTPHGTTVSHGDTVTNAKTGEVYTVFNVGGKLTKHTRQQTTLGELIDVELSVWKEGEDVIVIWDGQSFKKIGIRDCENGQVAYIDPEDYFFENEWDGGWCEALNAWIPLGGLTPANEDTVYYHFEETVNPQAAQDLSLYFWGFALDAPITQAVIDSAHQDEMAYWSGPPTEKIYFFDALNLILKEDDVLGAAVVIEEGVGLSETPYEHGLYMGPLTEDASYNEFNCWDIYESEEYYYWQTGFNGWNQFTTVKNAAGDAVVFDPPIRFVYTHSMENDVNDDTSNNGKKFSIDYDGFELHLPWIFNEEEDEWVPSFNLKDGAELVPVDNPSVVFVVKGTEESLIMNEVTDPVILSELDTTLPIDTSIEPPTLTYDAAKTALVGDVPPGAVLKVIKGELIE